MNLPPNIELILDQTHPVSDEDILVVRRYIKTLDHDAGMELIRDSRMFRYLNNNKERINALARSLGDAW